MKTLKIMAFGLAAAFSFAACDDDNYGGAEPGAISATYFNRLADGTRANLDLTYSGDTLVGKVVSFYTSDSKNAKITLNYIMPHEGKTTIDGVALSPDGKGGYGFSGASKSDLGTIFKYEGNVSEGYLSLNIKDVKVPGSSIGSLDLVKAASTEYIEVEGKDVQKNHYPFTILSDYNTVTSVGQLASLVGGFLNFLLKDVDFQPDGNVVATYAALPDSMKNDSKKLTAAIMASMGGTLTRPDGDYKKSPSNLATWFMANDTTIYVTPNVDMIVHQVKMDKAKTRSASIVDYETMYNTIQRWATTGIKLTVKPNLYNGGTIAQTFPLPSEFGTTLLAYEGDYTVTLGKDEFAPFLVLLTPELADQIIAAAGDMGGILGGIITPLFDAMQKAGRMDVTLFFNK